MKESGGFGCGCVPDASAASLEAFILKTVEPGSVVRTDGWSSYSRLHAVGYRHLKAVTGGDPERIERNFPRVHRVAALLKRWLLGTHQGAVKKKHLNSYLDEFTLRFNRRTSRSRGLLFDRLLQQAVVTAPTPQRDLIARSPTRRSVGEAPSKQRKSLVPPYIVACEVNYLPQYMVVCEANYLSQRFLFATRLIARALRIYSFRHC